VDDESRSVSVLARIEVTPAWLESIYGDGMIADQPLFDEGHRWFGTALSSFGIVFNRDALAGLGISTPGTWQDLAVPSYDGWITMVDPGMSGSVTTAFEAILQRRGWVDGWRILRRLAANARSFAGSSTKGPIEVAAGETAAAVCIDFYGR
jgi:iron(III) transport system substrate-binding protein